MKCPECGTPVGADEKFCGNCGAPLQAAAPEADQSLVDPDPIDDSPPEPSPTSVETVYSEPSQPAQEPISLPVNETSIPDPAGSLEQPTAPTPPSPPPVIQKGSTDKTLIIVIVVLAILLLCCCIAAIGIAVFLGSVDELNSMSMILPALASAI